MRAASSAWIVGGTVSASRVVLEVREQLLDEEWVALGGLDDALAELWRQRVGQRVHELVRVVVAERLEDDERRTCAWRRPGGPHVEEVGARGAEDEDRRVARRGGDVLDEVEERRIGPVDVVDDEHERPHGGERLEEPAERPGRLVGRAALLDDPRGEVAVADACQHLGRVAGIAHHVGQRQVGRAVP